MSIKKVIGVLAVSGMVIASIPTAKAATGYTTYSYVYQGSPLNAADYTNAPVYDEVDKTALSQSSATSIINNTSLTGVNLASFNPSKVQSISFLDTSGKYRITASNDEIKITLEKSSFTYTSTTPPLTINDIPSDRVALSLANNFLTDHGISTAGFGSPIIDTSWKQYADDKGYVPNTLTVIYPYQVNNHTITTSYYDNRLLGLTVLIDNRTKEIYSVYIPIDSFAVTTQYPVTSDMNYILSIATPTNTTSGVKQLALGTPSLIYVSIDNTTNPNDPRSLVVPALQFPVLTTDTSIPAYYRQPRTVPLVTINNKLSGTYYNSDQE